MTAPTTLDPAVVLATPMRDNPTGAATIGAYLAALLREVWRDPDVMPGWERPVYDALVRAGHVRDDLLRDTFDQQAADALVLAAIDTLASAPTPPAEDGFDWAIVEQLGHRRVAGRVRERRIAGAEMLRIDIPATPGQPARTTYAAGSSLYAIHPCDEATARAAAASSPAPAPVQRWEMPALGAGDEERPW